MDILGIGGWELITVLILMIVVAGPKRMIQWSYVLGRELAKVRRLWSEAARTIQKEFDDAGIDIKVPEQPPTRASLRSDAAKLLAPITKPMQDAMAEVDRDLSEVKQVTNTLNNLKPSTQFTPKTIPVAKAPPPSSTGTTPLPNPAPAPTNGAAPAAGFGAWSSGSGTPPTGNDKPNDSAFGAWSAGDKEG